MLLEHTHCFIVAKPENKHEEQLLKLFLEEHLTVQKKVYDPQLRRIKIILVKLYAETSEGYTIQDGFLIKLTLFLDKANIPYTYYAERDRCLTANWENIEKVKLRPFQEDCLKAIEKSLENGFGGVVVAPPAFGKSYLISMLTSLYKDYKIDIISRRRDVVLSNYKAILKMTPDVGLVTTGSKDLDKKITVYTADSVGHSHFDANLVILDEVHELVTDRYTRLLANYYASKVGLTATPDTRYDNLHSRIEGLCGPVLYRISYQDAEDVSIVVPIAVVWYPVNCPDVTFTDPISRKRRGIWCNDPRNQIIANVALEHYNNKRQVLVLVETIEHALRLKKYLPEFEVCYAGTKSEGGYPVDLGYTPISNKRREELRSLFQSRQLMGVIATGVWAVGVSFDDLEVLIRAEGSGSKTAATQVPGRVCRISSSITKPMGLVVDFIDGFERGLMQKSIQRYKCYQKHGWLQLDHLGVPLQLNRMYKLRPGGKFGKVRRRP